MDTFRADVAAYLCDDPTATITVQTMMAFARPLFDGITNECPALFERLKYFVNATASTTLAVNASAEFPRFGIIGVRCDTEAGLCSSRDLKMFLSSKNLLYQEQRKDRFGAMRECDKVDAFVREQMRIQGAQSEPIDVKCTWIRNRSSDMIFVSPLTLMMAIMHGQNTSEFKRYAGVLYMLTLIVDDEQASALKAVVSHQQRKIHELAHERDELMQRLEQILDTTEETYHDVKQLSTCRNMSCASSIKMIVLIVLLSIGLWLLQVSTQEHMVCQRLQLSAEAWNEPSRAVVEYSFFNSVAAIAHETRMDPPVAVCAMFAPYGASLWHASSYTVDIIG